MQSRNPPFSPLLFNRNTKLISQFCQPSHSTSDRDTIINIAWGNPQTKTFLHQDRIKPVTCSLVHNVVIGYIVAARLESSVRHVESSLNAHLIEKVINTIHIFADYTISHLGSLAVRKSNIVFILIRLWNLLIETLGIEIQHAGISRIELLISCSSDFNTGGTVISQNTGRFNKIILLLSIVAMIIQIFILIDAQVDIISRLPTLPWVSTGTVDHKTFESDFSLSCWQFIMFNDFISQPRNVNTCIALTGQIEVIFLQVREFVEKGDQSFIVVLGGQSVVACDSWSLCNAETYTSWWGNVEQICFHVPCIGVNLEANCALLESKGAVLVDHTEQTGAAGTSIEP